MTLKEKVEQVCPQAVADTYIGGVAGCPGDYDCLIHLEWPFSGPDCVGDCEGCWNREYKEPDNG
jgi:hypothetical protein